MTMPRFRERTVQFGRADHLNGVLTTPRGKGAGIEAIMIMVNSGIVHRVGASRLYVDMARVLASDGVATLRFDLSGIGESDVPPGTDGIQEIVDADLDDAIEFARSREQDAPLIGLGLCSGAHDLVRAVRRGAPLAGVILLDLFGEYVNKSHVVRHYAGRFARIDSWKNALFHPVKAISKLGERVAATREDGVNRDDETSIGVRPVLTRKSLEELLDGVVEGGPDALFVFTAGLEENYNYRDQFADVFPEHAESERVTWNYISEANHMFTSEESRRVLLDTVTDWMSERGFRRAPQGV